MKRSAFIIAMLLAFLATPFSAHAQTAMGNETANAYYRQCMAVDDARMNDESQESLCSCTSAKMMSVLTLEDLEILSPKPGPGRAVYDKMLSDAYAPCMQVPVEEQLYRECMNDTKIKQFALRDQGALCNCMAKESTRMMPVEAPQMMRRALKNQPDLEDAFDAMHSNPTFREKAYNNLFSCLHAGN